MVGLKQVKDKQADAFVSCGSTGAVLVGGQLIAGKIKGVKRPPLAPLLPTEKGVSDVYKRQIRFQHVLDERIIACLGIGVPLPKIL